MNAGPLLAGVLLLMAVLIGCTLAKVRCDQRGGVLVMQVLGLPACVQEVP